MKRMWANVDQGESFHANLVQAALSLLARSPIVISNSSSICDHKNSLNVRFDCLEFMAENRLNKLRTHFQND